MRRLGLGLLVGLCCAFTSQAEESEDVFDNRWFIGAMGGVAITDSSDFDSGVAITGSIGRALYPNLTLEGEVVYALVEVPNVAGTGQSADYERIGGNLKASYKFMEVGGTALNVIGGLGAQEMQWFSTNQNGFGGFAGLGLVSKLSPNFEFVSEARYTNDVVDQAGAVDDDVYYFWSLNAGLRYKFGQWPPPAPDDDRDGVPNTQDLCPNTPFGVEVSNQGCPFDTDQDGVADYQDKCPNTPPGVLVDEDGCPLDSDHDGVIDPLDQCPDTPEGVPVDAKGCPLDSDQDGVVDSRDLCPNTPLGAEVDVNGCPFDTDQDGVPDFRDDCPNTPYGVPVNERGCSRDNDGDGVGNDIDQCPNTFPGLAVDQVGCPIRNQVLTLHNVHFEFNRADLLPDSRQLLRKVAKSMADQPLLKLEVSGHTDALGTDAYNLKLSEKRAASVRSFLVKEGVPAANVVSKGYGESQPIAENATEEGRAQNRRVEIHFLD